MPPFLRNTSDTFFRFHAEFSLVYIQVDMYGVSRIVRSQGNPSSENCRESRGHLRHLGAEPQWGGQGKFVHILIIITVYETVSKYFWIFFWTSFVLARLADIIMQSWDYRILDPGQVINSVSSPIARVYFLLRGFSKSGPFWLISPL